MLEDHVWPSRLLAKVEELDDVRMAQRRSSPSFPLESAAIRVGREELHDDTAVKSEVNR
jgi:hypothetical protein